MLCDPTSVWDLNTVTHTESSWGSPEAGAGGGRGERLAYGFKLSVKRWVSSEDRMYSKVTLANSDVFLRSLVLNFWPCWVFVPASRLFLLRCLLFGSRAPGVRASAGAAHRLCPPHCKAHS